VDYFTENMNEQLLQFIWGQGLFDLSSLVTIDGEALTVLDRGQWNHDQGPDFTAAQVSLAGTIWAGHIELHLRTSDWRAHRHGGDPHYRNVVLHVVWEHDGVRVNDIPVLELRDRVKKILLQRYAEWMGQEGRLPCEASWRKAGLQAGSGWLRALVRERLDRKASEWAMQWRNCGNDWEELCWRKTAHAFGGLHNGSAFERMAASIPWTLLGRHRENILQMEALLLGQCAMLPDPAPDKYALMLLREYRFLAAKYKLSPPGQPLAFFRLRPGSFPGVRLAQLSMLLHQVGHLFARIRDGEDMEGLRKLFRVTANDYWHYHYRIGEPADHLEKTVGEDMASGLVINMAVPLLYTASTVLQDPALADKALCWLDQLPAEDNRITRCFEGLDTGAVTALGSQALLELKKSYCDRKRCLQCRVGMLLLDRAGKGREPSE
jgi:hypothetical protein